MGMTLTEKILAKASEKAFLAEKKGYPLTDVCKAGSQVVSPLSQKRKKRIIAGLRQKFLDNSTVLVVI